MGNISYTQTAGTPQYNMDAYNAAMQAYQKGGSSTGSTSGLTLQQYEQQNPNGSMAEYKAGQSGGSPGSPPQLSNYLIQNSTNPQYTASLQLSPEQQQLYNQQTQQSIGLSNLANQLQGSVASALTQPLPSYSDLQDASKKAQDAYYNSQMAYLQPQQQITQNKLDSQLANQGIMRGSDAYNTAQDANARQNTFANQQVMDSAVLQGPQNAQALFGLDVAAQNQPLNEYNALRSGSQVSMPSMPNTSPATAAGTNVAQLYQNQYQGAQNAYNQGIASNNAATSGLFGLGGSALGAYGQYAGLAAMSDMRLKENIRHVGYQNSFPVYDFQYINDPTKAVYRGVMAQDVQLTRPDAVIEMGGYLAVDYGKIGVDFGRIH